MIDGETACFFGAVMLAGLLGCGAVVAGWWKQRSEQHEAAGPIVGSEAAHPIPSVNPRPIPPVIVLPDCSLTDDGCGREPLDYAEYWRGRPVEVRLERNKGR